MPTHRSQPSEFRTDDLGVAAFLVAHEVPLLRIDVEEQRSCFAFPAHAKDIALRFYQPGRNLVDGRRFHLALRELRGLARGGRR